MGKEEFLPFFVECIIGNGSRTSGTSIGMRSTRRTALSLLRPRRPRARGRRPRGSVKSQKSFSFFPRIFFFAFLVKLRDGRSLRRCAGVRALGVQRSCPAVERRNRGETRDSLIITVRIHADTVTQTAVGSPNSFFFYSKRLF